MPVTPSEQEEEYFARLEFERRKKVLADAESSTEAAERQRVLAVARNRCPKCAAPLGRPPAPDAPPGGAHAALAFSPFPPTVVAPAPTEPMLLAARAFAASQG